MRAVVSREAEGCFDNGVIFVSKDVRAGNRVDTALSEARVGMRVEVRSRWFRDRNCMPSFSRLVMGLERRERFLRFDIVLRGRS